MTEEIRENLNPMENDTAETVGGSDVAEQPAKSAKPKKTKAHRMTKEEKQAAREAAKNKSKAQKAWEDSIVANKRVKREELNRKLKKAMLVLLIFSLVITSTVYVMLLFIDANNIRITATSTQEKSISLSFDKEHWSPYLDVDGPDNMWNISYNPLYNTETITPSFDYITKTLQEGGEANLIKKADGDEQLSGNHSRANVIEFCFYLRNSGEIAVPYSFEMALESNDKGLEDSIRVIWASHYIGTNADREDRPQTSVNCYASLSDDARLAYNKIGANGIEYDGGVEKIAYPHGAERWTSEQLQMYEVGKESTYDGGWQDVNLNDGKGNPIYKNGLDDYLNTIGYVNTTPFYNDEYVLKETSYLDTAETVCIYVCVWIEGSDYDCVDSALGGYVTLSIKFTAM